MAGTADILAGKSYVEIYLNRSLLTKGLKSVASEMKAFGAGVSSIGKKFMALGAAITAPMLAAAHSWASSGAELYRMHQRTGMAVESLSALKFAAETTGVEFGAMEVGIKKMQKAIYGAAQGKGGGPNFLRGLIGMDPEKQLSAIADNIARIGNPAERAAVAIQIFGRAGTAMLPMLEKGAAGLAEFRKEAENMGMIRSTADAKAALELSVAWEHLTGSVTALKNAIGGAIGPLLTGFFTGIKENVLAARDWIKANQPLVVNLFKIGVAVLAAGTVLFVLGKAIGIASSLFSGAAKVIGVFGHVISLITMPIKMVFSVLSSLASGVLSMVGKGFSLIGDLASGVVSAGMWILNSTISVLTTTWGLLTGAVALCKTVLLGFAAVGNIIIGVAESIGALITGSITLIGILGPIGIAGAALFAVFALSEMSQAASDVGGAVDGGIRKAVGGIKKAADAAGEIFDKAKESAKTAGTAIGDTIQSWGGSLKSFGLNIFEVTSKIFNRLWSDVQVGFHNLVKDVGESWGNIEALLSQGDFSQAWKVGLALMKLEWVRFSNYIVDMWRELTPKFNEGIEAVAGAIGVVGGTIGSIFSELKISWGDIWDVLMEGLKKFLVLIDNAMAVVKEYIIRTQAFMGVDPVEEAITAQKQREEAKRIRATFTPEELAAVQKKQKEGGIFHLSDTDNDLLAAANEADEDEKSAIKHERIAKQNKWLNESPEPLQNAVRGKRTPEEKAQDDKKTREQDTAIGKGFKDAADRAAKSIKSGTTQTPQERAKEQAGQADKFAEAQKGLNDANAEAAAAAKETARKRKEEQDKIAGKKEGGDMGLQFAAGSASARGTFSASAVSGLAEGGSPILKVNKEMKFLLAHIKKLNEKQHKRLQELTLMAAQ